MSVSRDPDRLVFFTDAVVAIAITLLVLPLVDLVPEAVAHHDSAVQVITQNQWKIYSFVLSFAVIARLWVVHHRVFEHVKGYSYLLIFWNMCWAFTIVVLPFPTEMVGAFRTNPFTAAFYIGTMVASSVCQVVLILLLRGNPELVKDGGIPNKVVFASVTNLVLMVMAMLLAALVPGVTYYGLLLLLLVPAASRLRDRRPARPHVQDA